VISLDYLGVVILSVLAVAMVIWYFKMRKVMILLMKKVTDDLEKFFKPRDKSYILLGYLVGYKAIYDLENGDKVYIVYTTVPKYSLLYYPIARIMGRTDKLHIAIKPNKRYVVRELHVVNQADSRLHAILLKDLGDYANTLSKRELETPMGKYIVYYKDIDDYEFTEKILANTPITIYKLSAYSRENLVEIIADVSSGNAIQIAEVLKEFNRKITRGITQ